MTVRPTTEAKARPTVPAQPHMRDSDAFSWYMERDPHLRSTVVAIAVLDRPPDWELLRARVDRATRRLPMFRARIVHPPLRMAPPRWSTVALDLDWHLQRTSLPPRSGWDGVLDVARRKAVTAFDPVRPLWEMTVVEGLPEGRAALVMVFHHSLTDGIGGVQLAMELFDAQRAPDADEQPVTPTSAEDLAGLRLAWESLGYDARRLSNLVRALPGASVRAAYRTARSPLAAARGTVRTAASIARFVRPVYDTKSPLMRGRRLSRSFDVLDVPLADLHRAGHATGGHLNDAFLGAVTGGLRRYHEHYGAQVDQLRVTLPISLRRPEDPPGGNLITLVRLAVPAGLADPAERMAAIRTIVQRWREEPSLALTQPIAMALNLLPGGVVGSMLKHVDFLASNVPGFPIPVYLAGARVEGYYPFGPTIGASLNVTLMSYVDNCCVGVSCDTAAVTDPDVLMECLRQGFEEVLDLGGEHPPVRRPLHDPRIPRPRTATRT
jgi:WS/DGAT/MGAT family acyltransferase